MTFPVYLVSTLFIHNYAQVAAYPIMALPQLALDSIFIAVVTLDTVVIGVGVYLFLRPKWWHVTATGSAVVIAASVYTLLKPAWQNMSFLAFAIILGVACFIVLGASIFILLRLWLENKKGKQ